MQEVRMGGLRARRERKETREGERGERSKIGKDWVEEGKVGEECELLQCVLPIHTCHLSAVTGHGRACPC